ncbi:MAG: alanine--tRNA ligase-related protein, partial [Planctomycetia bacterium]
LTVDEAGFDRAMAEQRARSEWKGSGETAVTELHKQIATELGEVAFLGYERPAARAEVKALIANGARAARARKGDRVEVVTDGTPFYGESGGQVGDTGTLEWTGGSFEVVDTQREGGFMLHIGHLRRGTLDLGQAVTARVDAGRRAAIRRAHSATHLIHAALQHHLGPHAVQQGSKVDADMLRFDFSHTSAVGADTLRQIETLVNEHTLAAVPVAARLLPLAEARHAGAMMLFGEKYPDVVRMVTMDGVSRELCGGTHVSSTGQIGMVKIVGEESVSAGTRRVTAVTGLKAMERLRQAEGVLAESAAALKVPVTELPARLTAVVKELKDLKKTKGSAPGAALSVDELIAGAADVGGTRIVVADAKGSDAAAMRQCIDLLRRKASPIAVFLGSSEADKVTLVAGISRELEARGLSAGTWIRDAATIVGGKGGGRPDLAQAGGKLVDKLPEALVAARKSIEQLLKA